MTSLCRISSGCRVLKDVVPFSMVEGTSEEELEPIIPSEEHAWSVYAGPQASGASCGGASLSSSAWQKAIQRVGKTSDKHMSDRELPT